MDIVDYGVSALKSQPGELPAFYSGNVFFGRIPYASQMLYLVYLTPYAACFCGILGNFSVALYSRHYKVKDAIVKVMKSETPVSDGQKNAEVEGIKTILGTIGDTTWRMFVPSVGFTLLGFWLDSQFDTKPTLMIAGIVVGSIFAVILVMTQLKRVKSQKGDDK